MKKSKSLIVVIFMSLFFSSGLSSQIRVACVGNSITAGYGNSDATTKSWPAQLGKMLGSGYSVLNFEKLT